jgi:rubrerythrin
MKKYLIPGLAGLSLILAGILIYTLGTQAAIGQTLRYRTQVDQARVNQVQMMRSNNQGQAMRPNNQAMMNRDRFQDATIDTDLSGSDYDEAGLEEILKVTLADEYKARAEYVALTETFGEVSPFVQLIRAETNHINALTRVFDAFGFEVPEDNGDEFAVVPASLEEAYAIGIEAETYNISLYEDYLKTDLPDDVERIFTNLMNASEKHLDTFEAYANGETPVNCMGGTQYQSSQGRNGRWS